MAAAHFAQRGATPNVFKSDLDMDSFFDFNQSTFTPHNQPGASVRAGSSVAAAQVYQTEEETFAGPSHEYDRFPQQTGVGVGDVRNLANLNQPLHNNIGGFGSFNSGIDESSFGMGWGSGIDIDSEMNMDMLNGNAFVDPSYIEHEEPQSNVGRLWPGMHQQAAMAKAQQGQVEQPQQQNKGKGRANQTDPHTEESISRLLNQMRQGGSNLSSIGEDDGSVSNGFSNSSLARSRKEEEDMDEDERLLASDEGKKLSSKERRQLRNKVSARAFRSRRKEYIGQLEGEVAGKAQENVTLKEENTALSEENARYRALIQTLLRHPSFTPFIEDISKDPAWIATQQATQQAQRRPSTAVTPQQHASKPEAPMMQDAPVDLSMLNINNGFTGQQNMAFDFSQPPQALHSQSFQGHARNGNYF